MVQPQAAVLDYGRPAADGVRRIARGLWRAGLVLVGSSLIGALLSWLLVPMVYVEQVLIYEQPTSATTTSPARSNALYTRAASIESPAFVQAAAAPLMARARITPKQLAQAAVHAELDRRTDLIEIRVEHPDPKIAQVLAGAVVDEAIKTARAAAAAQPANGSADPRSVALAQTVAQVYNTINIVQPPRPASKLTPHFTPLSWAVFFGTNLAVAVILLLMFRRWVFGTTGEKAPTQ
jgi:hypothetical protein